MSKEALKIGVDLGIEKDEQCAVINLHYNGIDHIIYEAHDKEQVETLSKIMEAENRKLIDNSNPSEALECLDSLALEVKIGCKEITTIKQALLELKSIKEANPSKALKDLECLKLHINSRDMLGETNKKVALDICNDVEQALLKAQEQEKENELLKEIIKSLFDRGCPLHQYTDKDFGLTIEVDNECSIMRLGEYKGIDLDKYLKEVLE